MSVAEEKVSFAIDQRTFVADQLAETGREDSVVKLALEHVVTRLAPCPHPHVVSSHPRSPTKPPPPCGDDLNLEPEQVHGEPRHGLQPELAVTLRTQHSIGGSRDRNIAAEHANNRATRLQRRCLGVPLARVLGFVRDPKMPGLGAGTGPRDEPAESSMRFVG